MESTTDTLRAIALLVVTLVAIIGSLMIDTRLTVMVVVAASLINGIILVMLTLRPKG